jgi:hypothetical protein
MLPRWRSFIDGMLQYPKDLKSFDGGTEYFVKRLRFEVKAMN